jgi:predicted transcriptional regulator
MRPSVRLLRVYSDKKSKALKLRRQGYSYLEIAQALRISKSTAYEWSRKVKLSEIAKKRIQRKIKEALRKGLIAYNRIYGPIRSEEAAKIREKYKEKAAKEISKERGKLSPRDLQLIGLALFWAEGSKKRRNQTEFSNSDPFIIQAIMRFFREVCKVSENKIKAKIHLYPKINPREATLYWSKITKLPITQFTKPQIQISKASKGKRPRNTLPYGTLHLVISNTELTWRIKGWIEGIINLARV